MTRLRAYWELLTIAVVVLLVTFLLSHAARAESGTWVLKDGSVAQVPCPAQAAQDDESTTLRLPSGCRVLHPRVGYTVAQDLKLREELPVLRTTIKLQAEEIKTGREASDAITAQFKLNLHAAHEAADAERHRRQNVEVERDAARAQVRELDGKLTQRFLWGSTLGIVVGAAGVTLLWVYLR